MGMTRLKAKGRRGGEAEHFARLPVWVMESEAVRSLDYAHCWLLACFAAGFRGRNNGALAMTPTFAARYGFTSKDTLYTGRRELLARGLIIETRQGWRGVKNHFALYALAWEDIHNREGKPLDVPEPRGPNVRRLLEWKPPTDSAQILPAERGNSFPASGQEDGRSLPASGLGGPVSVPPTGKTSRYLGGATDLAAARLADAMAIARGSPGISATDLQDRARCSEVDAHRALQQLQAEQAADAGTKSECNGPLLSMPINGHGKSIPDVVGQAGPSDGGFWSNTRARGRAEPGNFETSTRAREEGQAKSSDTSTREGD